MANQKSKDRITKIRIQLLLKNPFYGYLAINLPLIEEPAVKTMATDGEGLFYNPAFVKELDDKMLEAIIAHEVLHCALGHLWRREERDRIKWNYAADYAINLMLLNEGFTLPSYALCDRKFSGLSAENIYNQLPNIPNSEPEQGRLICSHDKWPVIGSKKSKLDKKWRERLARAAAAAKMRGKLPGKVQNLISDLFEPKLNWKIILQDLILSMTRNDFRLLPPVKKHLWRGMYLPSTYGQSLKLAIGIDTSSSVNNKQFQRFLAELRGIAQQFSTYELYLFFCDTQIHNRMIIETYDEWPLEFPKKDGGTSFDPVLKAVSEECPDVSGLVYLTDGNGAYSKNPPSYPVIWILNNSRSKMIWGEVVEMEE